MKNKLSLTADDPQEGLRLATKLALLLDQQSGNASSSVRRMEDNLRMNLSPHPDVVAAIYFGAVAAANNYWRG
jgi:hypothetical protein